MRELLSSKTRMVAVSLLLSLISICCIVSTTIFFQQREPRPSLLAPVRVALQQARERWDQRPISHYRLQAEVSDLGSPFLGPCQYDIEVRDEQVVQTYSSSCSMQPLVLSQVFGWTEGQVQRYDGQCGANGCECDGPVGIDVITDQTHGYVQRVTIRSRHDLTPQYRNWQRWFRTGGATTCTLIGSIYPSFEVKNVIPLT